MPAIERGQPFSLPIQSVKADGSPNSTIIPTITISRDCAAATPLAQSSISLIPGLTGSWKVELDDDAMDCDTLTVEHGGAGLAFSQQVLVVESAYTGVRAGKLDNVAQTTTPMTLAPGEYANIANEVERQIIDETDPEKVLTAITDKIASVNPSNLTTQAIAAAVINYPTPSDNTGATIGETIAAGKLAADSAMQNSAALLTRASEARLAKLETVAQNGTPVTLPSAPPAGYGLTLAQDTKLTNLDGRLTDARAAKLTSVAQTGDAMNVNSTGVTNIVTELERPLGLLSLVNMGVNWLTSMTELIAGGVRRFKATAFPAGVMGGVIGGGAGGGTSTSRIPDINVNGYTLSKNAFWATGREMLAITVLASGGDYPTQMTTAGFFIGLTPISQTSPPDVGDCIQVTPFPDGVELQARLLIGSPEDLAADTPTKHLAAGSYKVWLWIVTSYEVIVNPVGQITVMA